MQRPLRCSARTIAVAESAAPNMVRASPTFADLGDDVIEELARDFERELDVIADELQTVTASADAGCTISSGGHDDYLRRALDDQELRALFQELEPSTDDKAEGDAVTVADTTTATIKPSIDTQAEARERERSSANTIGNNSGTNNVSTSNLGITSADTTRGTINAGTRSGHEKKRKRRRRTPRRTTPVRGRDRLRSESTAGKLSRHRRRHAKGRSAAGVCRPAAPRHRSRAARKRAPSNAISPLGGRGAAARAPTAATATAATTSTAILGSHRINSATGMVGANARSTLAAAHRQRQQQQRQQQQQIRHSSFGGAAVTVMGTGDVQRRGSEGSPLRQLRDVLITATLMAALSTAVSGRRWLQPLVLVAVPLVHALASWMAKLYRNSSRYDSLRRVDYVGGLAKSCYSARRKPLFHGRRFPLRFFAVPQSPWSS